VKFADAEGEIRSRFAEAAAIINHLRSIAPPVPSPVDDMQKSLRALCLVSIYAAFERGVNAVVEAALGELTQQGIRSVDYIPSMHSVVHYSRLQSIKDSGPNRMMDVSCALFEASFSENVIEIVDNPFAEKLQNVDGGTLVWLSQIFGIMGFAVAQPNHGRLGTLRERRNAVAHGREAGSRVGERYNVDELGRVYEAADQELTRFLLTMQEHCDNRRYVRNVA
jgi:hypothetical protein